MGTNNKFLTLAATIVLALAGFRPGTALACEVSPTRLYQVLGWDAASDRGVLVVNSSQERCGGNNVYAFLVIRLSTNTNLDVFRAECSSRDDLKVEQRNPEGASPNTFSVPRLEWKVVAAKTQWAKIPLEREHTPDPSGRVTLVEKSENSAYLAVRSGDSVTRLLWLPMIPKPREKGSLSRTAQVWKAADGVVVIVTMSWTESWHRPRRETFAYHFTYDDLAHPQSEALQARFLRLAENTKLSDGLYRTAAEIAPLPLAALPRAICDLAKPPHETLAKAWFRKQVKRLTSDERQLFFDALRKACPPAFLHHVKLGPKVKDVYASPRHASGPCSD